MNKKLLFITGLQKSGTSLLNRLMLQQHVVANPFMPEGKVFWGDDPPFSPQNQPCGRIYQSHFGQHGHEISLDDFNSNDLTILESRIVAANVKKPLIMNKNPYLVVRIKWLKKMFPACKVVVVIRNPISNIYSLTKKYHVKESVQELTDDGWWGVKPKGWAKMVSKDKIKQTAYQWRAVYQNLIASLACVDMVLDYPSLCQNPNHYINSILSMYNLQPDVLMEETLSCMDDEYKQGGQLESRNVGLRKTNSFKITSSEQDYPAFSTAQIETIDSITDQTWSDLLKKTQMKAS